MKIIYIDDEIDIKISEFLATRFGSEYCEYQFSCESNYEELLTNTNVIQSNIVIIDSVLFENDRVRNQKFTGEEFKIILRKLFPFIEVIVITQNEQPLDDFTIRKFNERFDGESCEKYYEKVLLSNIEKAKKTVESNIRLCEKISNNETINKFLIEKIQQSIEGISEYDELSAKDIDNLIEAFEALKEKIDV